MAAGVEEATQHVEREWADFAHTGPGTLAGRYLRRFWQPVYRSEDLASETAVPIKIMNEEFTLYRGQSGAAHLMGFRCVHRGTQLSSGWIEGDDLRCRYHGWLYDSTGQCIEQPGESHPFCERARIRSYPVHEYLGLIFGYFGEGEAPPLPRFPEFEQEGMLLDVSLHPRMCNYFNNLENSCDEVHVSFAHFRSLRQPYVIPEVSGEETSYGIIRSGKRPDGSVRLAHLHMPNSLQLGGAPRGPGSGWTGSIAWRVPIDDESHLIPHVTLMQYDEERLRRYHERHADLGGDWDSVEYGATILTGKMTLDAVIGAPNAIPIQDEVTQVGQGRIADRQHELLGRTDAVIVLLRTLWMHELRALQDGRPLKEWRRDDELLSLPSAG